MKANPFRYKELTTLYWSASGKPSGQNAKNNGRILYDTGLEIPCFLNFFAHFLMLD